MNMPSQHGHVIVAGKLHRALVQTVLADAYERSLLDDLMQRRLLQVFQDGVRYRRLQLVAEMERKITERDEDDLFLILSV